VGGAAEVRRRRVPDDEQRDDEEQAVRGERAADTKAGLPALERERQLGRVQAVDLHRDVSVACYGGTRRLFGHQAITVIVPRLVWITRCKKAALGYRDWRPGFPTRNTRIPQVLSSHRRTPPFD